MRKQEWLNKNNNALATLKQNDSYLQAFIKLIGRGYFPTQLPPPFSSKSFGNAASRHLDTIHATIVNSMWGNNGSPKTTQLYKFNLARPKQLNRTLGIPHPSYHFLLSLHICSQLDDFALIETQDQSKSMSYPVASTFFSDRAFDFQFEWPEITPKRLASRTGGTHILEADIARFFPSIYTHSIPWAIHGKLNAKQNRGYQFIGNWIDMLIRYSQDGQTLGIPIGPDTSHLISERILLKVDQAFIQKAKKHHRAIIRTGDDYQIICDSQHAAEASLAILQQELQVYELELNTLKTEIRSLPTPVLEPEFKLLREFDFDLNYGGATDKNESAIIAYSDLAFNCFKSYPKGTLKFAINRLPHFKPLPDAVIDFLGQCITLEPGAIESALIWLAKSGQLSRARTSSFLKCLQDIIIKNALIGHTSEVAWAIWGHMLLEIILPTRCINAISEMDDPVVLILAMDARRKKLINGDEVVNKVKSIVKQDQLYDRNWLLTYECSRHGWLKTDVVDHVKNNQMFNLFQNQKIEFYDVDTIENYKIAMKKRQISGPYDEVQEFIDDYLNSDDELPF